MMMIITKKMLSSCYIAIIQFLWRWSYLIQEFPSGWVKFLILYSKYHKKYIWKTLNTSFRESWLGYWRQSTEQFHVSITVQKELRIHSWMNWQHGSAVEPIDVHILSPTRASLCTSVAPQKEKGSYMKHTSFQMCSFLQFEHLNVTFNMVWTPYIIVA